jgi:hypothetical protein
VDSIFKELHESSFSFVSDLLNATGGVLAFALHLA